MAEERTRRRREGEGEGRVPVQASFSSVARFAEEDVRLAVFASRVGDQRALGQCEDARLDRAESIRRVHGAAEYCVAAFGLAEESVRGALEQEREGTPGIVARLLPKRGLDVREHRGRAVRANRGLDDLELRADGA